MKWIRRAKMPWVFLLFFIAIQANANTSQSQFTFTPLCVNAAKQISLLKLKYAAELLQQEKALNPDNCAVDYLENYIDFYSLITNQDIAELRRLEKNKQIRLSRIAKVASSSPYKLYAQAEINLQWAFSRVFQQEFFTAAMEFRESYKLLEENTKLFPDFVLNKKDFGMLKAMLGTIPDNLKWVLNIVGMKGDFKQGMNMLKAYVEQDKHPSEQLLETQSGEYYYIFLQLNFGNKQECWNFCEKVTRDYKINLLSCYLRTFTGIKTAHNEEALYALQHQPNSAEYTSFPILDYLAGISYLNKVDTNAVIYLKKYVSLSKGQNLIKDAYKRLSWHYLINGDVDKFHLYQNMVLKYGAAVSEEDKLALKEAQSQVIYNTALLKARLLYDGGYFEKSIQQLQQVNVKNNDERVEVAYRYGRIYHELKQYTKAMEYYESCVRLSGMDTRLYFAPVSCNQLGVIYELLGNKDKAVYYYEKTLTYKGYDYKNSTSQKAKNALSRLKS